MAGGRFVVSGVFRAVDRMSAPLRRITGRLDRMRRTGASSFADLTRFAQAFKTGFLIAGAAVVAALALIAAGLREVISVGAEFEQTLTNAAAKFPGQIRAGTEEFEALEDAARNIGATTEFTASQAAGGLNFLAMAGFSAEQAIAALPAVVDLATATQMDLARATDIASDTLGAFGLASEDATELAGNLARVNDVLARTTTSANTDMEQLFEVIKTGGPVARDAGQSIETFSAMAGVLANAGIKGSLAGTAMRNMFLRLQAPAAAGRRALRRVGLTVTDADGNLRDMIDILDDLGQGLDGMGGAQRAQILNDIFGMRAVSQASVLLNAGADSLRDYRAQLENAEGAAGQMASTMRDTTQGDLAALNSAIESVKLEIFDAVKGPLRDIVEIMAEWFRANREVIGSGLQDFIDFLRENWSDIVKWGTRLGIVLGIILALILAILAIATAALVIPFMIFIGLLVGIIALVEELWDWIAVEGPPVWQAIVDAVTGFWNKVVEVFTAMWEFIVGVFVIIRTAVMALLQPWIDFFSFAAAAIMEQWRPIGAFFAELFGFVSDEAEGFFGPLMSLASQAVEWLMQVWKPVGEFFRSLFEAVWEHFQRFFGGIISGIGSIIDSIRSVGRAELESGQGQEELGSQVVGQAERVSRAIQETTTTTRGEVTIRDESGRAEVTRRPARNSGVGLRVEPSGAF